MGRFCDKFVLRYDRELLLSVSGCPLSRSHHGKPAEAKNPTRNRPHRKLWRFLAPERLPAATPERQVLVHGSTPRAAEDIHTPSQPPPRSWRLTSTARSHVSAVKRRHEAVTASTDSRPESDRKRDFDAGRRPSLACCQSKSARPRSMPVCDRTAAKSARISLFANTRRRPASPRMAAERLPGGGGPKEDQTALNLWNRRAPKHVGTLTKVPCLLWRSGSPPRRQPSGVGVREASGMWWRRLREEFGVVDG